MNRPAPRDPDRVVVFDAPDDDWKGRRKERINLRAMLWHVVKEKLRHRVEMNALLWRHRAEPPIVEYHVWVGDWSVARQNFVRIPRADESKPGPWAEGHGVPYAARPPRPLRPMQALKLDVLPKTEPRRADDVAIEHVGRRALSDPCPGHPGWISKGRRRTPPE